MLRLRFAPLPFLCLLSTLALSGCDQKPAPEATPPAPLPPPSHGDAREPVTHFDPPGEPATARRIVAALGDEVRHNNSVENSDHIFLHLLEVYHHSGLDLAQAYLRGGKNAALRLAADTLRHRSERNLQELEALRVNQHRPGTDFRATSPTQVRALQQALQRVHRPLATPVPAGTPDEEFAALAALFYQSGLVLAQTELRYGRQAQPKTLAAHWLAAQQRELEALTAGQRAARPTP
ncbi:hypothetical protein GCM10011375_40650 [Hymenobacter qilianensis]|uniref:Uncharacterized protein n=2 Tax=Hymenobacter qilianensis TaxID=1385715 RepID=A0ACB5PXJ9_9BACT|nr:DUF305 domain-containing protein [Hymenobacter qilianensis]QNP54471.1 DUF305 domain-containing protein [Hymenobacter qilianensis]GGF81564.1 hypothetical protein GCM10011375_40650 [Hymenobacter qilianensis]